MIRQFQSADAPSCCALIHACLETDPSLSKPLREKMIRGETPAAVEERARLFYLAVCEVENRIVGMVGLDMNEIRILCVAPAHQRQGIGRSLLDHIRTMVPAGLFSDIFVYSSLPAVGFYKGCGFVERGTYSFPVADLAFPTVFLTFSIKR